MRSRIPRGVVVEKPIEITYEVPATVTLGGPIAVHPRTLILVEEGAHCTIVETYKGEGKYFTNAVTEVVVGDWGGGGPL